MPSLHYHRKLCSCCQINFTTLPDKFKWCTHSNSVDIGTSQNSNKAKQAHRNYQSDLNFPTISKTSIGKQPWGLSSLACNGAWTKHKGGDISGHVVLKRSGEIDNLTTSSPLLVDSKLHLVLEQTTHISAQIKEK